MKMAEGCPVDVACSVVGVHLQQLQGVAESAESYAFAVHVQRTSKNYLNFNFGVHKRLRGVHNSSACPMAATLQSWKTKSIMRNVVRRKSQPALKCWITFFIQGARLSSPKTANKYFVSFPIIMIRACLLVGVAQFYRNTLAALL